MPIRLAIFDLDGTLADTLSDIAGSMNRALARRGHATHSVDAYRTFVGDGIENVARRVLPAAAAGEALALVGDFRDDYENHLLDATAPYPGIPALLDALVARDVQLAIVSNKPQEPARRMAEALFANWPWLSVHGQSTDWPLKPDPTLALAVAAQAGVLPAHCLFVGDSDVDMLTGVRAGMHPVGVLWGFRSREELAAAGAEVMLEEAAALLPFMDRVDQEA